MADNAKTLRELLGNPAEWKGEDIALEDLRGLDEIEIRKRIAKALDLVAEDIALSHGQANIQPPTLPAWLPEVFKAAEPFAAPRNRKERRMQASRRRR